MSQNDDLAITKSVGDVMQISPADDRAWLRIQKVREAYQDPEVRTITEACEAAGVVVRTYYRDIENPYVRRMLVQEANALQELTLAIASRNWYSIMIAQAKIATDPKNRNAVAAARFVADRMDKAADTLGMEEEMAHGTLDDLMRSFASMPEAKKRVSATRKTKDGSVTMEIEG